ncbi:hypothetical protein SAMN04487928_105102 [Butyrivibrio proteoclasticus]|uniref:Uncharacterized protein n=1 Tax=Butyrivibrio proteoclasticus TaxID=43305 RepID=A0A1I5S382_9FIRM|nr:hypothetical protein [Butyrivibrio proteoclasticus]SFP65203.1 hypothetical protein SAMN04487928_105102 [Butyrivibrio proteoclasticus]
MENQLYSYEEVCSLIQDKGMIMTMMRDEDLNKLCQFGSRGSILNVNTLLFNRYQIHANEKDYNAIKRMAESEGLAIVIRENEKDEVEDAISGYEEIESKAILFIKNGNRVLQLNDTDKSLPHEIVFFTNDNLDLVLECLCENDSYKPKPKSTSPVVKVVKPVEPELTDDEIKEIFAEGCEVNHKTYGHGLVKTVLNGKLTVEFDDSVEKILSAKICIKNKLLSVV